jgi:hypothetical protein
MIYSLKIPKWYKDCIKYYSSTSFNHSSVVYKYERENYCLQVYLSFLQHESLEIVFSHKDIVYSWFDTEMSFKNPEVVSSR